MQSRFFPAIINLIGGSVRGSPAERRGRRKNSCSTVKMRAFFFFGGLPRFMEIERALEIIRFVQFSSKRVFNF